MTNDVTPNPIARIRTVARGQTPGLTTHWVMAAAILWTFPRFAESSAENTFVFYALGMVGQLIRVLVSIPETIGVPLEEREKKLGIAR